MTPSYQKGRSIDDHNVLFAERFYTHQSLAGFGSVEITPVYENDNPVLKTDIRLKINPVAKIGELQQIKLKEWMQRKR